MPKTQNLYNQITNKVSTNNLLPQIQILHNILYPHKNLKIGNITQQQILAQIYQHLYVGGKKGKIRGLLEQCEKEEDNVEQQEDVEEEDVEQDIEQVDVEEEDGQQEKIDMQEQYQQGDQNQYQDIENDMQEQQEYIQHSQQQQQYQQQQQEQQQNISENDVGLYGQQLDQQQLQSYENQEMEDDPQFRHRIRQSQQKHQAQLHAQQQQDSEQDIQQNAIEDNFTYYRQLENKMDNAQANDDNNNNNMEGKTELEKQIQKLEDKVLKEKNWQLKGQVKSRERPVNSLLEQSLDFKTAIKYGQQAVHDQTYNQNLETIIKGRILDQLWDDRVRYSTPTALRENFAKDPISTQKSNKGLAQIYQLQFKNYLGLGQNKDEKIKKQIMSQFKEINYYLDSLSNLNFTPKAMPTKNINNQLAITVEEKVPMTMWDGSVAVVGAKGSKRDKNFEADKERNLKQKRLRNKRVERQHRKKQHQKKQNKMIEYGGKTKYEVQAKKIIKKNANNYQKTTLNKDSVAVRKFNKSQQFFGAMSSAKDAKDKASQPRLSKMKI